MRKHVYIQGDSLMFGLHPYLPDMMRGFTLRWDVQIGRHTSLGVDHLSHKRLLPRIVLIGLGVNDDPNQVGTFDLLVHHAFRQVRQHHHDCHVFWVNIFRADMDYHAYNHVLNEAHVQYRGHFHVVNWHALAQRNRDWFTSDPLHVHPTQEGYKARANLCAQRIKEVVK